MSNNIMVTNLDCPTLFSILYSVVTLRVHQDNLENAADSLAEKALQKYPECCAIIGYTIMKIEEKNYYIVYGTPARRITL